MSEFIVFLGHVIGCHQLNLNIQFFCQNVPDMDCMAEHHLAESILNWCKCIVVQPFQVQNNDKHEVAVSIYSIFPAQSVLPNHLPRYVCVYYGFFDQVWCTSLVLV